MKQTQNNSVKSSSRAALYGLKVARDILKSKSSETIDDEALNTILSLPSPEKENAFVMFALTGEVPSDLRVNERARRAA